MMAKADFDLLEAAQLLAERASGDLCQMEMNIEDGMELGDAFRRLGPLANYILVTLVEGGELGAEKFSRVLVKEARLACKAYHADDLSEKEWLERSA